MGGCSIGQLFLPQRTSNPLLTIVYRGAQRYPIQTEHKNLSDNELLELLDD